MEEKNAKKNFLVKKFYVFTTKKPKKVKKNTKRQNS